MMLLKKNPKVEFAIRAVRQAASLVEHIQQEMVTEALTKDDRSPVTIGDFAAQAYIGCLLGEEYPMVSLVGEESSAALQTPEEAETLDTITGFIRDFIPGATPEQVCAWIDHGAGRAGEHYWTLDPIDGTKGFLRGAQYAVALALVEEGEVHIGALACPNLSEGCREEIGGEGSLLIAERGSGSWLAPLAGEASAFTRIHVSDRDDPARARLLRSFVSGHTNVDQIEAFNTALGAEADPVLMDSQAKYAVLAAGHGEIYLRLLSKDRMEYREKVWDQAAGSLIVQEAGGTVTDLDGRALDFTRGRRLVNNRGICATNGSLHPEALRALREINA
jgi:3'(2'), 5'-bisphosphate nucleotidase